MPTGLEVLFKKRKAFFKHALYVNKIILKNVWMTGYVLFGSECKIGIVCF